MTRRIIALLLALMLLPGSVICVCADEADTFDPNNPDHYDHWGRAIYLDEFGGEFFIDDEGYPCYVGTPVDPYYDQYDDLYDDQYDDSYDDGGGGTTSQDGDETIIHIGTMVIGGEKERDVYDEPTSDDDEHRGVHQHQYGEMFYPVNGACYPVALQNFRRVNTYTPGVFPDVPANAWYAGSVASAYELGLMKGDGNGRFNPDGQVTLAETYALAARISSIYKTGEADFVQGSPWYQVYYDYVNDYNYYAPNTLDGPSEPATREQFAVALAAALPVRQEPDSGSVVIYDKDAWPVINEVLYHEIPDLNDGSSGDAELIFRLYTAGVLTGSDAAGSLRPNDPITRKEVAAIIERIAFPALRRDFTAPGHRPIRPAFYDGTPMPTVESVLGLTCTGVELRTFSDGTERIIYQYADATGDDWRSYTLYLKDYADDVVGEGGMFGSAHCDFFFYVDDAPFYFMGYAQMSEDGLEVFYNL